ncbi:MAG: methylenetetrahydrofolate reductase [NAD(P)H] [Alphaproteobacteria bacterium]|nr:methylenetetrahydrofolate reductase [NAD(P)H] [Alphaproteobacteria bacterium]
MSGSSGPVAPAAADLSVSFEFFPPKSEAAERQLWATVERLAPLAPDFVSVTYGAGGTTRERTHATVSRIVRETGLACAAHLTCVAASRADIDEVARQYWAAGVRHIVALRGDAPDGAGQYRPEPSGYTFARDLVAGLARVAPFEISVAAYPETHPEAASAAADLDNLKRKLDAGATRAITQFFFDIAAPLVPGIMPVSNFASVARFARQCGAGMPPRLARAFEGLDDDPETRRMVAVALACEQVRGLQAAGVRQFHFYTLNRADLTYAICHLLGLRPVTFRTVAGGSAA